MRILVTGATGFIGNRLCQTLVQTGHEVVAMYRNHDDQHLLQHASIQPVSCDILDPQTLATLMQDCEVCFHLAALARPWSKNADDFHRVNVTGTRNVFAAAQQCKLRRIVFTSTAGVFGPATAQAPVDESTPVVVNGDSPYEKSKQLCEEVVSEFQGRGLDIVTVYPTRVFGPGALTASNALTKIFIKYMAGKWRWVPGKGNAVGNYVYVDDVVDGHQRAMEQGRVNAKYLLGGENLSFLELLAGLQEASGIKRRMIHVRPLALRLLGIFQVVKTRLTGRPPLITPEFLNKYLKDWHASSDKAKSELGYQTTPIAEALTKTIGWMEHENLIVSNGARD